MYLKAPLCVTYRPKANEVSAFISQVDLYYYFSPGNANIFKYKTSKNVSLPFHEAVFLENMHNFNIYLSPFQTASWKIVRKKIISSIAVD